MKKFYALALLMVAGLSYGQNPIITAIVDGPCSGGTPKLLEIYANGTVDFTQYSLQNQTNANTTWGTGASGTQDLSTFGTRTNTFVYVIMSNNNLAQVTGEFPNVTAANSLESGTMNLNGDDRVRIINTSTTAVIDQFGVSDVDGTGTTWEWLDTYAMRNNGTGPDAGFFEANWTINDVDVLDNTGVCTGNAALSTIVPLGTYNATGGIKDNSIAGFKMYPNPLTGNVLNITSNSNADKTVAIFDVLGKQVVNAKVTDGTVNVSNLTAGVYIVKVTEEGKTATRKLVVK
jgi:hypothetical protein